MGDLSAWAPRSNGFPGAQSRRGASFSSSSSSQQQPNPHPSVISAESWREAEKITQQIIQCIQPTVASEERRMAIISYVQMLIKGYLGSEVFPFGSVPLKTYLPDGDIDLTALCSPKTVDALACNLCSVLQLEEQNKDAEFEVKDVQYICAEVKLVKCLIQNIVVDISFNQIGGLCTICFLEQVDHLIQKDHLFKRSIILIKAWCYYESRILGAHHGLISTYALETLVLYIFHLFHSSLDGPLAVLYKFLDYFSKFDWDNYCISLRGPVSLSSLPELVAETPEADGGNLLLSKKFLDNCVKHFSASTMGLEGTRRFPLKHLNIVDLLKENNNLGRSVSRGNFYRIRSAFAYGARNLGQILLSPQEYIADEIRLFFTNTIERHGNGERLDIQDSFPSSENGIMSDHNGCVNASSSDSYGALHEEISSIKILNLDREHWPSLQSGTCPSNQHQKANTPHKYSYTESCSYMEENVVSSRILAGDAGDRATNPTIISKTMGETCKSSLTGGEANALSSREAYYASHFFCNPENGIVSGLYDQIHPVHVGTTQEKSSIQPSGCEEDRLLLSPAFYEAESSGNATYWLSTSQGMSAINEGGDTSLSDLQGNYHLHYRSLLYARWCQEYLFGGLVHPVHPSSPSYIHRTSPSDELQKKNGFSHVNANGPVHGLSFVPSPTCYSTKQPLDSDANVTEDMQKLNEDIHKPHGTRTYFSGKNYRSCREKQPPVTQRNLPAIEAPAAPIHGGEGTTLTDMNLPKKEIPEASPSPQLPVCSGNDCEKPNLLDNVPKPLRPAIKESSHANGSVPEPKSEFQSFASVALGISSKWISKRSDPANSHSQCSTQVPSSAMWKPGTSSNNERTARPFQLKDDNDFPPLSGRKYDSNFPPLTRSPRKG